MRNISEFDDSYIKYDASITEEVFNSLYNLFAQACYLVKGKILTRNDIPGNYESFTHHYNYIWFNSKSGHIFSVDNNRQSCKNEIYYNNLFNNPNKILNDEIFNNIVYYCEFISTYKIKCLFKKDINEDKTIIFFYDNRGLEIGKYDDYCIFTTCSNNEIRRIATISEMYKFYEELKKYELSTNKTIQEKQVYNDINMPCKVINKSLRNEDADKNDTITNEEFIINISPFEDISNSQVQYDYQRLNIKEQFIKSKSSPCRGIPLITGETHIKSTFKVNKSKKKKPIIKVQNEIILSLTNKK